MKKTITAFAALLSFTSLASAGLPPVRPVSASHPQASKSVVAYTCTRICNSTRTYCQTNCY
jgi:hypothetical protein